MQKKLSIAQSSSEPDVPKIIQLQNEIGIHREMGIFSEAEVCFRSIIDNCVSEQQLLGATNNYTIMLMELGRSEEAVPYFRRIFERTVASNGRCHATSDNFFGRNRHLCKLIVDRFDNN